MSRTFKIVKINNKNVNIGRYTTNSSPSSVAKKVFTTLYKQMKNKLKTFMIKETTQGSNKKIYGPYKGKLIKLKKPKMVKFKGKKELVPIKYERKVYKIRNKKNYKGGSGDIVRVNELITELERRTHSISREQLRKASNELINHVTKKSFGVPKRHAVRFLAAYHKAYNILGNNSANIEIKGICNELIEEIDKFA